MSRTGVTITDRSSDRGRRVPAYLPWKVVDRYPTLQDEEIAMSRRLVRPRNGRMFAGVCAGLAQRFGMSAGMVRLIFVLSLLLPGTQVIIYLALWIVMPNEDR